jgi:hypothetical protein
VAYKVHEIKNYNYSFDARSGWANVLQLWGDSGLVANVNFVDDAAPVPPPSVGADLNSATAFFKRSMLALLIDMLRYEKPVSVTINDQPPGFVFVHTGLEPVGEEES